MKTIFWLPFQALAVLAGLGLSLSALLLVLGAIAQPFVFIYFAIIQLFGA